MTEEGVSIITCTNKLGYMENIFSNYANQEWQEKELIIILNSNSFNIEDWDKKAAQYPRVNVFQLPEYVSLGNCLNFAVDKANYDFIAKFDDDDYYAPKYLLESIETFHKTNADVVGKRSYYMYMSKKNYLFIRFPGRENQWMRLVHGGTIVTRKEILKEVPFADLSLGEDVDFLRRCRKKGFQIHSTSHSYYTYIRREDECHTWKADDGYLLRTSRRVKKTSSFQEYANKGPYEDVGEDQ